MSERVEETKDEMIASEEETRKGEKRELDLSGLPRRSFRLVYKMTNGEPRIYSKLLYMLYEEASLQKIAEWRDGHNNFGHFLNKLCKSVTSLWLLREWIPEDRYSWEEYQVWVLDFGDEDE